MPDPHSLQQATRRDSLRRLAVLAATACRRVCAALALLAAFAASPLLAQTAPLLVLGTDARTVALDPALEFFMDSTGQLTPEQLEQLPASAFARVDRNRTDVIEGGALWLRFDAVVGNPAYHWRLAVPLPGVDDVRLYFRNAAGAWLQQQAGDSRSMDLWPQPGRYPVFALNHEVSQPTRYYLAIRHARVPFSALPRLASDAQLISVQQQEHMLLGIYFGLAALVVTLALANALAYRDLGFGSYALYMALFAAAQGALTGVAGLYWWPELPALNNPAAFLLPVAANAAAVWFVRTVTTPRRFSRALDWFMLGLIALLPLVGLLDAVFPTLESFGMINALAGASMVVLLIAVGVALVEGDRHARWLALGFLPVLLATAFPLLRNLGLVSTGFLTEYGMMLASSIEAPILFYGLLRRVAQRREPKARATALRTTDPLTGLFSGKVMVTKLRQALDTAGRYPQPFALLVINFINQASLQHQHGRETGDRAMVMAAARIRAVAGPADTVARVGDSQFALLMEGPVNATEANNAATKILASGLRPSNELPDAEPLQFHIAVGHLGDASGVRPDDAGACLSRMQHSADDLNDGSGKAIRLVKL
ncbi:MAG: diguanylate cyclase [Polaromonas sp.]|nr:diguanylate cyclase [Polaromonas sp.]